MPDTATIRTEISDSRLARRLQTLALLATGLTGGVLLWTWAVSAGGWRLAGALAPLAMLAVLGRRRAPRRQELTIAADGAIALRVGREPPTAAQVRYCSPMLVCLRGADGNVAIWRDAVPSTAWRRLLVACRWLQRHDSEQGGRTSWRDDRTK